MKQFLRSITLPSIALVSFAVLSSSLSEASNTLGKKTFHVPAAAYSPQPQSASTLEGKAVLEEHNCLACHSIQSNGGCLAPPFDGIGTRRSSEFITTRITGTAAAVKKFEHLYPYGELFSHPLMTQPQAALVTSYLLTLPEPKNGYEVNSHEVKQASTNSAKTFLPANAQTTADDIEAGKLLFKTHGCMSCHSIGNLGGHFAPNLDGIANRREAQFISNRIDSTEFLVDNDSDEKPGTTMPPTNLTAAQIEQVTTFLLSLPTLEH
jgi:cytochrome c2